MAGLRAAITMVDKVRTGLVTTKFLSTHSRQFSVACQRISTRTPVQPSAFQDHLLSTKAPRLNLQHCTSCQINQVPCRYLNKQAGKHIRFNPKHKTDGVPTDLELIYQSSMRQTYMFFLVSGAGVLIFVLTGASMLFRMLHIKLDTKVLKTIPFTGVQVPELYYNIGLGLVGIFGVPLWFVCRMLKISVIRMYHKKGTDLYATVVTKNLFMKRTIDFTLADVVPSEGLGRFGTNGNVIIKGRRCHLFPADFTEAHYFNTMLGYTAEETNDKEGMELRLQKKLKSRQMKSSDPKQTNDSFNEQMQNKDGEKRRMQH